MSRSIMQLLVRSLVATVALFFVVAAYCAPSETPAPAKEPEAGAEKTSAPAADAQPGTDPAAPQSAAGPQPDSAPQTAATEQDNGAYLLATASPGTTMTMQGPELAIARLNPQFVARLADAIRDARQSGLPGAGIFSAYRPPAFGIGGFGDKFKSMHSYGLAVDMTGIGDPDSAEAKLWHEIAARHGVICPYGYANKTEWNHCQATDVADILPDHPLRKTITADGPIDLAAMFAAGDALIAALPAAIGVAQADNPQKGSIYRVATAESAETLGLDSSHHHGRAGLSEALAHRRSDKVAAVDRQRINKAAAVEHRRMDKVMTIMVADNERSGRVKTSTPAKHEHEHEHERNGKGRAVLLAKNEERVMEKSHGRRNEEAKAHGVRKGAARSAEGHHELSRRHHVA